MVVINPYLNFKGRSEEAFNFYKKIFGGDFAMVSRFKDTPEAGKISAPDGEKIMHIALPIGKDNVLMATDVLESMGQSLTEGNNIQLSVHTDNKEEADRVYNGLAEGGNAKMPMENTFWGSYFGMATDKFGINWMVSYDANYQKQ